MLGSIEISLFFLPIGENEERHGVDCQALATAAARHLRRRLKPTLLNNAAAFSAQAVRSYSLSMQRGCARQTRTPHDVPVKFQHERKALGQTDRGQACRKRNKERGETCRRRARSQRGKDRRQICADHTHRISASNCSFVFDRGVGYPDAAHTEMPEVLQ
jgi:hypothetical protein